MAGLRSIGPQLRRVGTCFFGRQRSAGGSAVASRLSRMSVALIATLAGFFVLSAVAMAAVVIGTNNGETLNGTPLRDRILAKGGDDTVNALASGDLVRAGEGNDTVNAGRGPDVAFGGNGNDVLN